MAEVAQVVKQYFMLLIENYITSLTEIHCHVTVTFKRTGPYYSSSSVLFTFRVRNIRVKGDSMTS